MMTRTFALTLLSAAACASFADVPRATTMVAPDKARSVLIRFLTTGNEMPMSAIVVQRSGVGLAESIQIEVKQDSHGRRRTVVLAPLSAQGSVAIDDGRQWKSFCPDTSRLVVAPSSRDERIDVEARVQLAMQNYRFAVEKNTEVAGRAAVVVVAVPRSNVMPTRRIALDASHAVLLRLETIDHSGDRDVLYDTKRIDFPDRIAPSVFAMETPRQVRVMRMDPPVRVTSATQAKTVAGFTPIIPKSLRYGFVVRESEVGGMPGSRYVALRITDGIAAATLYQWPSKLKVSPLGPDREGVDRTIGSVTMRLVGDLSRGTRLRILEGIANSMGKTFGPIVEPQVVRGVLVPKREPQISTGNVWIN